MVRKQPVANIVAALATKHIVIVKLMALPYATLASFGLVVMH